MDLSIRMGNKCIEHKPFLLHSPQSQLCCCSSWISTSAFPQSFVATHPTASPRHGTPRMHHLLLSLSTLFSWILVPGCAQERQVSSSHQIAADRARFQWRDLSTRHLHNCCSCGTYGDVDVGNDMATCSYPESEFYVGMAMAKGFSMKP